MAKQKGQNNQNQKTQNQEQNQQEKTNLQNQPAQEQNQPEPNAQENAGSACEQNLQSEQQNQPEQNQQEEIKQQNQPEPQTQKKKELIAFRDLAEKYRLPTWQSAAILKLLDKEDDVCLSEQEFIQAVEKLYNRKMGA